MGGESVELARRGSQSSDLEKKRRDVVRPSPESLMSSSDHKLCVAVFILVGTSALYYWNAALNVLYAVVAVQYPESPRMTDIITGIYTAVAFVTAMLMTFLGASRPAFHFTGGAILLLMCLLFPYAATKMSGTSGLVVLYIGAAVAGITEMLFQVSGFAMSVMLPRSYASWLSLGYGVCGILTFCIWMLLSEGIFKISAPGAGPSRTQGAVWVQFVIGAAIIAVSMAGVWYMLHKPSMREALKQAQILSRDEHDVPERELSAVESGEAKTAATRDNTEAEPNYWRIFFVTWPVQMGLSVIMMVSMCAYPNIGPYQWRLSIKRNDILTGMFQIGDFLGRYLVTTTGLASWMSWVVLKVKIVVPLTLLRLVLLTLFILVAKAAADGTDSVLRKYGVQVCLMIAMAFTNGWYAAVYMTRVGDGLTNPKDKAKASSIAIALLVFSISAGIWLASLVKFGF